MNPLLRGLTTLGLCLFLGLMFWVVGHIFAFVGDFILSPLGLLIR